MSRSFDRFRDRRKPLRHYGSDQVYRLIVVSLFLCYLVGFLHSAGGRGNLGINYRHVFRLQLLGCFFGSLFYKSLGYDFPLVFGINGRPALFPLLFSSSSLEDS